MLYETRSIIWESEKSIKAGDDFTIKFDSNQLLLPVDCLSTDFRYKLWLRGDVDVQQNWMFEGGYPLLYRDIDDALCTTHTNESQFSLHFDLKKHLGRNYPRRAYCKVACPPELSPQFPVPGGGLGIWNFSISAKAENLILENGGQVGVKFEVWTHQQGYKDGDINPAPQNTFELFFDVGSYDFQTYSMPIEITQEMTMILVTVFALEATGSLWVENPSLKSDDNQQLLPQFTLSNSHHEYMNWMGENLSHKDWTDIQPVVNDVTLPVQSIFQRCHRGCEFELSLPEGLIHEGVNTITLRNVNNYHAPLPYKLMQVALLHELAQDFNVISFPKTAIADHSYAILVATNQSDLTLEISSSNTGLIFPKTKVCPTKGLHVIKGTVGGSGTDIGVTITANGVSKTTILERIVVREHDNVITGTSDSIYIPQDNFQLMQELLAWYFHNQLGNFITFRPVYRWTGGRVLAPETWEEIRRICTELEVPFCHIIDGRELPGMNANPTKAMLDSPFFVGNQGHERDGSGYYWRQRRAVGSDLLFHEVFNKQHQHPDYTYSSPIIYKDHGNYLYYDPVSPKNMQEAAEQFVKISKSALNGIKRHTGPSVLFKYFFEAGLEVGGAEIMYGPQEIILAALRGASIAYHRNEFIAHLAVQWSSTPHDTPERYLRYQLSLFSSYLQGVNHINTEEGLYRMEELFTTYDRFSDGCMGHKKIQQEFAKFVATHTRRGNMVNPIAMLHGRFDAWVCFTRQNAWGHYGDEWKFGAPEESWDLLKLFYPDSNLNAVYSHPCPNEPQGFFSRTPYGNVDILPIEASIEVLNQYPFMAFMGYNATLPQQIEKLVTYVEQGGTLLLSWAHLNTQIDRNEIIYSDPKLVDTQSLTGCTPDGYITGDCNARLGVLPDTMTLEVLKRDKNNHPLVLCNQIGKGKVLIVNTAEFPAHPEIRPTYLDCLKTLTEKTMAKQYPKGWMIGEDYVETAVYDNLDGSRVIYAINTNWWDQEKQIAHTKLHLGDCILDLSIPRGFISTLTLTNNFGVLVSDNETEVLAVTCDDDYLNVSIQGKGETILTIIPPSGFMPVGCDVLTAGIYSKTISLNGQSNLNLQLLPLI